MIKTKNDKFLIGLWPKGQEAIIVSAVFRGLIKIRYCHRLLLAVMINRLAINL